MAEMAKDFIVDNSIRLKFSVVFRRKSNSYNCEWNRKKLKHSVNYN